MADEAMTGRLNTCASCHFWKPAWPGWQPKPSQCRRHAPVVTNTIIDKTATTWPSTTSDDWCGEYEVKG